MRLELRGRTLELRPGSPLLMGIVNAGPDSFSDSPGPKDAGRLLARAHELVAAGAAVVDVGGESGRSDRATVSVATEIERVTPLIERLAGDGVLVSADTWRAPVAEAALAAGAAMINDVSALSDVAVAQACARAGAALVVTHTRAAPKTKAFPVYADVVTDVAALLGERSQAALDAGVAPDALLVDPGLDLAKAPAESVEILCRLDALESLGRPLLLAISRKDFVGALTGRRPAERDAGTLGAVEAALDAQVGTMLRVHDVAGAADFLAVRHALRGRGTVGALPDELRREAM